LPVKLRTPAIGGKLRNSYNEFVHWLQGYKSTDSGFDITAFE
jgi:hypothetical protein